MITGAISARESLSVPGFRVPMVPVPLGPDSTYQPGSAAWRRSWSVAMPGGGRQRYLPEIIHSVERVSERRSSMDRGGHVV